MKAFEAFSVLIASVGLAMAGDAWPMFRGPNGAGSIASAKPPVQIGPDQGVLWKIAVPEAPSSPVVWGDRIFLTTYAENQLETRAYDRRTGKQLWSRVAPARQLEEFHETDGSPASSTPAVDAEVVVSYFGSAGLFCYNHDGQELWRHELPVARTHGGFGSGASPILAGDRVILNRDVLDDAAIFALDRKTGKKLWQTARPDSPTSYSTAILWEQDGVTEVIVAGAVALKAYDLATGGERWTVRGIPPTTCTTPVLGDGMLFFAGWGPGKSDAPFPAWESRVAEWDKDQDGMLSAEEFGWGATMFRSCDANADGKMVEAEWNAVLDFVRRGENVLLAIKPGGRGDVTETHVAWKATRGLPYVPSPVYFEGRVYIVKDGGLLSSFNARDGEPAYVQERIPAAAGSYYASPVAADGRLYLASLQGMLTVLRAGGDQPQVLHQAAFGERISATPALVGGQLYLRTAGHLYAFGS
jgi:outer membrane protein assembly factor BamB